MPRLSVIVPTIRVGGLDILFDGLARQEIGGLITEPFTDFELVLVDCLYAQRAHIVAREAKRFPFKVKHIPPCFPSFPTNQYSHCVNTGLVHSAGEIAVITCDYVWFDPDSLFLHSFFHETHRSALMGYYRHAELNPSHAPPTDAAFPRRYGPFTDMQFSRDEDINVQIDRACSAWMANYQEDVSSGVLDPFMWSLTPGKPFGGVDLRKHYVEERSSQTIQDGPISSGHCDLKNDSIPLQTLLDMNGLDEDFDGCHVWQDSEIGERIDRVGLRWRSQASNLVYKFNAHYVLNGRRVARPIPTNEGLLFRKRAAGYPRPNHWDLTKARNTILGAQ